LVIVNTGPLWVALIERFFLKSHVSRGVWTGLLITIVGSVYIAIYAGNSSGDAVANPLMGAGLALLAAIAGAGYITLGRSVRQKISLFPYIWIVFGFGGLVGLVYVLATGTPILGYSGASYGWLLMLTFIAQLIGHSSFNYVLGYLTATITSISSQMLTLTGSVAAFFIFGEVPQQFEIVGSIIIICGVLVALLTRKR